MVPIPNTTREKSLQKPVHFPVHFNVTRRGVMRPILNARRLFLFLDLDGTLVDIAPTPSEVKLSPERRRCLAELVAAPDILIAVVSGRAVEEIQQILQLEGIFYVGLHGLVLLSPEGERVCREVDQGFIAALRALRKEFDRAFSAIPGLFLEDKGLTLALHFRLAKKGAAFRAASDFVRIALMHRNQGVPLEILQGKEVVEVKPAAFHKGDAVIFLLDRYGKGALPVYLGDDVTDEAAFRSLRHREAITIAVTEVPKPTAAAYYLRNTDEVYAFLKQLIPRRGDAP